MALPDISTLHINGVHAPSQHFDTVALPNGVEATGVNDELEKLKNLARLLPYSIEPESQMQETLDLIIRRICQAVEAQDYDVGFLQWDTMLSLFVILPSLLHVNVIDFFSKLDHSQVSYSQRQASEACKTIF